MVTLKTEAINGLPMEITYYFMGFVAIFRLTWDVEEIIYSSPVSREKLKVWPNFKLLLVSD